MSAQSCAREYRLKWMNYPCREIADFDPLGLNSVYVY